MNNKLLSVVLVAGIATTGFAGISSADEVLTGSISNFTKGQYERVALTPEQEALKVEAKSLRAKKDEGIELTAIETSRLEELKAALPGKKGGKGRRGGKGIKNLTDTEKTALKSMSDEDKKTFFETKRAEMKAKKEAKKAIMDKILAGTTLSSTEEATRLEIVAKMADKENNSKGKKRGGNNASVGIMKKLINLETLTAEEKTTLTEMKAKHEERITAMKAIAPIIEKKKSGTELTEAEETQLESFKLEYKNHKKYHGKRGEKRHG